MPLNETNIAELRAEFPALQQSADGRPLIFFDGPGGTQVHGSVIEAMQRYLTEANSNVHGAFLYSRAGLVEWGAVWRMGIASVVTAVLGARAAVVAPGNLLKVAFGIFLIVIAIRLVFGKKGTEPDGDETRTLHTGRALAGGAAVGFFSALLGVGGGLVAIPVLIYGLNTPIRKVTGTAARSP